MPQCASTTRRQSAAQVTEITRRLDFHVTITGIIGQLYRLDVLDVCPPFQSVDHQAHDACKAAQRVGPLTPSTKLCRWRRELQSLIEACIDD